MTLMSLMATLGMDVSAFRAGAQQAKSDMAALKSEADGMGSSIALSAHDIETANNAMMRFAGETAAAGLALSGISALIAGVAASAIELAGSFQQAEIGFSTMMGSAQNAQQFLSEMRTFAASSPFEFPELLDASRRLMAMGFEAQAVVPIMRTVGDAVAGLGGNAQTIDRITLALGQMQAKGVVSAQEMNQLAESGIPAWEALASAIGVSIPEAMQRAEQRAISSAQAIPAILESMQTRFGGMMEAQMQTVAGQWSNFKDQLSFILADIGRALLPFADMVMSMATPILGMLRDIATGFAELPQPVQGIIVGLTALTAAVGPLMLAFAGFTAAVSAVGTALGVSGIAGIIGALLPVLGPVALAITAAGAAWAAWDNIPAVREAVTGLWEAISSFWTETLQPFLETVAAAGLAFATFAGNVIGSGLQAAWEGLQAAGSMLWEGIVALADALSPLWDAFRNVLDALSPLLEPIGAVASALGQMLAVLVTNGLILAWESFKASVGLVLDVVRGLGGFIVEVLLVGLRGLAETVRGVSEVWSMIFKPAVEFVIGTLREFLGVLAGLPGVKQAIEAVGGSFDALKGKVTGAMSESRATIQSFGAQTQTSMGAAKTAVEQAQASYDSIVRKFRDGKANTDDLRMATERLATAKSNFRSELERAKPRIDAVMQSMRDARREYDLAEQNVRAVQRAFDAGHASADQLAAAHNRMKTAADNVKTANAALKAITEETGVTMNQYSGGIETVKRSLENKTTATTSAKGATDALKSAVDSARLAYKQTYDQWQAGAATEQQLIDRHGQLQEAIDRLHPERVAERQATGHREMMERYDSLLHWFETNIPKLEGLNNQLIASNARLASEFEKEHQKIVDRARQQVVIDIKVTDRLPAEVNAAIQAQRDIQEAYRQLGITSTATFEEKARKAQEAYGKIKDSALSSINDQLRAEQVYLRAVIEEYRASGVEIPAAIRDRLAEIERDLGGSHERQKSRWETFSSDVVNIGRNLQRDFSTAVIDLFSGEGWSGFKEAGLNALKAIGDKLLEIGIDYVKDIFAKNLKDIITDIIPSLTDAFRGLGSFVVGIFRDLGSVIVSGARTAIGWLTGSGGGDGVNHNNAGPGGPLGSVINSGAGAAASAGGEGGMPTQVLPPIVTAFMEIAGYLQGRRQEQDIGRIEVSTRGMLEAMIGNNGVIHYLNTYMPKLQGFEDFNYRVVAPGLGDIADETREKGLGIWRAIDASKDVFIQAKDYIHDLVFAVGDLVGGFDRMGEFLQQIRDVLIDIRSSAMTTELNTARFTTQPLEMLISSMTSDLSTKLLTVSGGVTTLSNTIGTSFANGLAPVVAAVNGVRDSVLSADLRSTLTSGFSNLGLDIRNAAALNNPTNMLMNIQSAFQNGLSQLSSNIITLANSSMRNQPVPSNNQYIYINGVQTISGVSQALASQGVRF